MKYIRFLKPPKLQGDAVVALITITSDLGESLLSAHLSLIAVLRPESDTSEALSQQLVNWNNGMRTLKITFDVRKSKVKGPIRVQVLQQSKNPLDLIRSASNFLELPPVISAWSDVLYLQQGVRESDKFVERKLLLSNGTVLGIWEETGESIARHIWDAGLALVAYIDHQISGRSPLDDAVTSGGRAQLRVLELGAGCGIVGIGLAQAIPHCGVVLTDLAETREMAQRNIDGAIYAKNSTLSFIELDWGFPLPASVQMETFDLALVADCTYNPDTVPTLVNTLGALVTQSPKALVIVSMKVRHESELIFFDLMKQVGLNQLSEVKLPLPDLCHDVEETAFIYTFRRGEFDTKDFHPLLQPLITG